MNEAKNALASVVPGASIAKMATIDGRLLVVLDGAVQPSEVETALFALEHRAAFRRRTLTTTDHAHRGSHVILHAGKEAGVPRPPARARHSLRPRAARTCSTLSPVPRDTALLVSRGLLTTHHARWQATQHRSALEADSRPSKPIQQQCDRRPLCAFSSPGAAGGPERAHQALQLPTRTRHRVVCSWIRIPCILHFVFLHFCIFAKCIFG